MTDGIYLDYNIIIIDEWRTRFMAKWFQKQSRLVQLLLLIIPGVNWVVEVLVRWSAYLSKKKPLALITAIFVTVFGMVFGWVDAIYCLITKHLLFAKG